MEPQHATQTLSPSPASPPTGTRRAPAAVKFAIVTALGGVLAGAPLVVSAEPASSGLPPAVNEAPAVERAPRRRDATWSEIFGGPFSSSRLFSMPVAQIVGAYQVSLSGDASLVTEEGVLSTSSVVAIGFGDIAQLEYRNSAAVTTAKDEQIGLPSIGVQLAAPFALPRFLPGLAVALRFGLPQESSPDGGVTRFEQRATDLYFVADARLSARMRLHAGLRVADARLSEVSRPAATEDRRTLLLPAVGIEFDLERRTALAAEFALIPRFDPDSVAIEERISQGAFGRAGIRWKLLPSVIVDASVGYRIEVNRVDAAVSDMANAFVDWDIRLGGEIFIPWGAVACRSIRLFCE